MKDKWIKGRSHRLFWVGLFSVFSLIATIQAFHSTAKYASEEKNVFTDYNNYVIFKKAADHLKNDQDLYVAYHDEYWDLYKYTPTFAAFFSIFNAVPDEIGLFAWNALNALLIVFAVYRLPHIRDGQKALVLLILTIEMITSIQNEQSNGLMTGLILMGFAFLEERKYLWATLLIVCSVYIKLFGLLAMVFFLFHPDKKRLALYTAGWFIVLFLVPLLFVSWDQYMFLWESFGNMLRTDHDQSYGYSVMGILNSWSGGWEVNKGLIVGIGALLFLLPFARYRQYGYYRFRLLTAASLLLWIVIFNHKAESPTFVIAMAGIGLWYITTTKSKWNIGLVIAAFILTSLSSTDLFPADVRNNFIKPYSIKALPSVIIWCLITIDLLRFKGEDGQEAVPSLGAE